MRTEVGLTSVWIRIGFKQDPNPAFYLNADPDSGSQTDADSDQAPLYAGNTMS
jgi:hypothetical protein